jgi:RimJ/RimL family protein N-acetyltransferase
MAEPAQEPIITERLILRQIQPSDAEAVFAFMSLPSVMKYTYYPITLLLPTPRTDRSEDLENR